MIDSAFHALAATDPFPGWEFDDLLGAPILARLVGENLFLRRCIVQAGFRVPVNLRPYLQVPKHDSSKGRGFAARGHFARFAARGTPADLDAASHHLKKLDGLAVDAYGGRGFANQFDYASRGGDFPAGLPTVVWTGLIAETYALAHQLTDQAAYLDAIRAGADFILHGVERMKTPGRPGHCFAYAPGRPNLIHNANLIAAATLVRADIAETVAADAYRWSLSAQNHDGSWFYGLPRTYHWIDNFHTGYVIDALLIGEEAGLVPPSATDRSVTYWLKHFFRPDGAPRYVHNRTYPIDIQCCAQAIETAAKLHIQDPERFPDARDRARQTAKWTIRQMQKPSGAFRYRRGRFLKNDFESLHWGQASMLSALGYLLWAEQRS